MHDGLLLHPLRSELDCGPLGPPGIHSYTTKWDTSSNRMGFVLRHDNFGIFPYLRRRCPDSESRGGSLPITFDLLMS